MGKGRQLRPGDISLLYEVWTERIPKAEATTDDMTFEKLLRNRALLMLLSKTELFPNEIVSLQMSDLFEPYPDVWGVSFSRKGRRRVAIVGLDTKDAIEAYRSRPGRWGDNLFQSIGWKTNGYSRQPLSLRGLHDIVSRWDDDLFGHCIDINPRKIRDIAKEKLAMNIPMTTPFAEIYPPDPTSYRAPR